MIGVGTAPLESEDVSGTDREEGVVDELEGIVRQARRTFGATLPKDYLTAEEYKIYERLYGPPLRETRGSDLDFLDVPPVVIQERRSALLREDGYGDYEEVNIGPDGLRIRDVDEDGNEILEENDVSLETGEGTSAYEEEEIEIMGANQREIAAIMKLKREMDSASPVAEELIEEEEEEDQNEDEESIIEEEYEEENMEEEEQEEEDEEYVSGDSIRSHPHTMAGRWGTKPSTVYLPKMNFVLPITELLTRTKNKHLKEAAEKTFGGVGLPYSAATPGSMKNLTQKHIGLEAAQYNMSEIEADIYMSAVMPGTYAAVMSTLVETRKRLGTKWLRDLLLRDGEGPRFLDAGAGGAGLIAWRQIVQAEWDLMYAEGLVKKKDAPHGKSTVLTGAQTLRHRMSRFLDDTTFLPRLPDYIHSSNSEKLLDGSAPYNRTYYDVVIAPHTLLPLKEDFRRKAQILNLWSLTDAQGGVLSIIEKGIPRGFEAVAGARSLLLKSRISSPGETIIEPELQAPDSEERFTKKETGMIIAPCTNHTACPMYKIEGTSFGRKDFCHFSQRFLRPGFLSRLLGASGARNHEDINFSYISLRRGVDTRDHRDNATTTSPGLVQGEKATLAAFEGYEDTGDTREDGTEADPNFYPQALPRAILPPLKRHKHVTLDLCTPSGTIERWTVPKSFSKQAFRDARKSSHGDLWALGAKTRVPRNIRLGRPYMSADGTKKTPKARGGELGGSLRQGQIRKDAWLQKKGSKHSKDIFEIDGAEQGWDGVKHQKSRIVNRYEKRTKGGRLEAKVKKITERDMRRPDQEER